MFNLTYRRMITSYYRSRIQLCGSHPSCPTSNLTNAATQRKKDQLPLRENKGSELGSYVPHASETGCALISSFSCKGGKFQDIFPLQLMVMVNAAQLSSWQKLSQNTSFVCYCSVKILSSSIILLKGLLCKKFSGHLQPMMHNLHIACW